MRVRNLLVLPAVIALVCTFFTGVAHATGHAYTWSGSGDGHTWTDENNWEPPTGYPGKDVGDSGTITSSCAHIDNVPPAILVSLSMAFSACGGISGGPLTITSNFSWLGGTLDAPTTIPAGATASITGASTALSVLSQSLTVGGTLTLSGLTGDGASNQPGLRIFDVNNATIPQVNKLTINAGATLISDGPNTITDLACCVHPARIVNNGTLRVSGGDFVLDGIAVDQQATLDTSTDDSGRLVSDLGPATATDGAAYTGNGSWLIRDGSIARLAGTQNLGSGFHLELGGLDAPSGARLGGTATLAGTGTFDWTGGTVEGNLTIAHGVTTKVSGVHTGNGHRTLYGSDSTDPSNVVPSTLTNHGSFVVDNGAAITTGGPAHFANASDGTVSFAPGTSTSSISCCVNPDKFTNAGELVVPTGTSTDPVDLDNFAYQATGGSTSIAAGRALELTGGANNMLTNTTVTGGGTLVAAAPVAASGTVTIAASTHLTLPTGSNLTGTATISGAGAMSWTGGAMSGKLTLAPTGGIAVTGTAVKTIANINGGITGSTVTFKAPTTLSAGTAAAKNTITMAQSTLTLASSTTMANHTDIDGGTLINTGSLTIDPGSTGEADRSAPTMTNRGTVTVKSGTFALGDSYTQAAGTTKVAAGTHFNLVFVTRTVAVTGGTFQGAGSVGANLSNTGGIVSPSGAGIATLHVAGSYTQGPKGRLAIDLGATSHDVLAITGSASLQGSLTAHNLNYKPKLGGKYTVLTSHALTTGMSCVTTSGTSSSGTGAGHWATGHSATALSLTWKSGAHTHC